MRVVPHGRGTKRNAVLEQGKPGHSRTEPATEQHTVHPWILYRLSLPLLFQVKDSSVRTNQTFNNGRA